MKMKGRSFAENVRDVVRRIPRGHVLTYGQVAKLSGAPGAARAVGTVMRHNFDRAVPCHRVVRSSGEVGEYNRGGSAVKIRILKEEGVQFVTKTRVIVDKS
ncbi:MAG: MGMT family protein [Candidatus Moranbacteria bacterium]|nr:MGMT family protein [Candidatus Moranbacteria bacterium]